MTARRTWRALATAAVLSVGLAICACADERQASDSATGDLPPTATVLDENLMIALAQAKNYHHKADVHIKEAKLDQAIAALAAIDDIPFPTGAPEAEDVKFDARARRAKLMVGAGALDDAMALVDQSIESAGRQSFFVANLHTVKGEIYEARANLLDDAPAAETEAEAKARTARARMDRRSAIMAFDRAISINTELQKALMNERTP